MGIFFAMLKSMAIRGSFLQNTNPENQNGLEDFL